MATKASICWTDQLHSDELEANIAKYKELNREVKRLQKMPEDNSDEFYSVLMERNRVSELVSYGNICRARINAQ